MPITWPRTSIFVRVAVEEAAAALVFGRSWSPFATVHDTHLNNGLPSHWSYTAVVRLLTTAAFLVPFGVISKQGRWRNYQDPQHSFVMEWLHKLVKILYVCMSVCVCVGGPVCVLTGVAQIVTAAYREVYSLILQAQTD